MLLLLYHRVTSSRFQHKCHAAGFKFYAGTASSCWSETHPRAAPCTPVHAINSSYTAVKGQAADLECATLVTAQPPRCLRRVHSHKIYIERDIYIKKHICTKYPKKKECCSSAKFITIPWATLAQRRSSCDKAYKAFSYWVCANGSILYFIWTCTLS